MKRGRFEIAISGPKGSARWVTGYTDGVFGIDKRDDLELPRHGLWVVTHLRTGCSIGLGCNTLSSARKAVALLYQLDVDWNRGSFGVASRRSSLVRSLKAAAKTTNGLLLTALVNA